MCQPLLLSLQVLKLPFLCPKSSSQMCSNVPFSTLPKWVLQCFAADAPWAGGKQHKAHGTMLEKKENPVCVLTQWGETRGDRTVCFVPAGCKQGVWRRPSRDEDGAAELMCPGDVKWESTSQCLQGDPSQEESAIKRSQSWVKHWLH